MEKTEYKHIQCDSTFRERREGERRERRKERRKKVKKLSANKYTEMLSISGC